jgi:hypothetical protein
MEKKSTKLILSQETLHDLTSTDPAFNSGQTPVTITITLCQCTV